MPLPRWTVPELITRYTLEPKLRDIFVEGYFDKNLIDKCMSLSRSSLLSVYVIDSIQVDGNVLAKHGLTSGNKNRLIALAHELSSLDDAEFKILIDKDLDHWICDICYPSNIVTTRFSDMEMHFLDIDYVKKFILDFSSCNIIDCDDYFNSLVSTLLRAASFRLAVKQARFSVKFIELTRFLNINNHKIVFDFDEYIRRCLMASGKSDQMASLRAASDNWFSRINNFDHKLSCRGHDFIDILVWTSRKLNGYKEASNDTVVHRTMILLCDGKASDILQPFHYASSIPPDAAQHQAAS
jgi:hypothetical protein